MNFSFKILLIFFSCFILAPVPKFFKSFINDAHSVELNLNRELMQGNILIGLKQYIGGDIHDVDDKQALIFSNEDYFLKLESSNGVSHESNEIKIIWRRIMLDQPLIIKRFVVGPFASYESAFQQSIILQEQGYETQIAFPDNWEVWLPYRSDLTNHNDFQLQEINNDFELVPFLETEFFSKRLEGAISINSEEDIKINNKNYGKNFYLVKDSYGTWTLVQKLSFDDYLRGILPHEIGSNSPLEALKSQAVIARTWALYNSRRFEIDGYHLCITTQCQVYKPTANPAQNIIRAIAETSNMVLTYQDKPVNAFYHASNGGISATASESWQMEDHPYFQTAFDWNGDSQSSLSIILGEDFHLKEFFEIDSNNFFGNYHYLFRWEKVISNDQIKEILLNLKLISSDTYIANLEILERGVSGRVTEFKILLNNPVEEVILLKDDIRKTLNFLPSNLFIIDKKDDDFWEFKGGGFGHGVGLSQSGAIEMAKSGFSFERILNHYYPGTNLMKIEDLKY